MTEELIPGGSSIEVTNENVNLYMHRFAHYKLNVEIAEQSRAFLNGFRALIPVEWIRMFNTHELKLLISGDHDGIDLQDLRRHVVYHGGYHDQDAYINGFWSLLSLFSTTEQSEFLKFVTSCPRQPLLGFAQLEPKFGIYKVPTHETGGVAGGMGGVAGAAASAKLPTAATCMNLLKLPQYDSLELLRHKLLYAIQSNSGFELS